MESKIGKKSKSSELKTKIYLLLIGAVIGSILAFISSIHLFNYQEKIKAKNEYLTQLKSSITQAKRRNLPNWQKESKNIKRALANVEIFTLGHKNELNVLTNKIDCLSHQYFASIDNNYAIYIDENCSNINDFDENLIDKKFMELTNKLNNWIVIF